MLWYDGSMSVVDFAPRRILLTGGGGFIGSHLTALFLSLYPETHITVVDNFLTGRQQNVERWLHHDRYQLVEHDLTDIPWLQGWLEAQRPFDLILHFASPASPPRYQEHPVLTYQVNSQVTHELARYTAQQQARMVFASTSEVYGDPLEHPQTEAYWGNVNPNGPRSCYDESKRMGETICGVWHRESGADIRLVRIFNTYGPHMDPYDGRVIPEFCMKALHDEPLVVYGDGSQTRSFCYVEDLVNGIHQLATLPNLAGQTMNIGNPDEYTMLDLVRELEKVLGKSLRVEHAELPKDDPQRRRPDITKAKQLLNWKPQISLAQGLHPTLSYFEHVD